MRPKRQAKGAKRSGRSPKESGYSLPLTREQARGLVWEALNTTSDEPEPFVKILLMILDNLHDPSLEESIYHMLWSSFNGSLVHSMEFHDYLDRIRQGRNPLADTKCRLIGRSKPK